MLAKKLGTGTPEWQIIGVGVEDSSIEYPDTTTSLTF